MSTARPNRAAGRTRPAVDERSLVEAFARRAALTPNEPALHTVSFDHGKTTTLPYTAGRLWEMVAISAGALAEAGVTEGDRVVLSLADPAEFLASFFGAQCIGAIPVPTPSLADGGGRAHASRISSATEDARPRAAFVDSDLVAGELVAGEHGRHTRILRADFSRDGPNGTCPFSSSRDAKGVAFLQYTSGSTRAPRGVVVRQANLLANVRALIQAAGLGPGDIGFSWLPLFHDMGLMGGLLLGVYLGIPTYISRPRTFVSRPESWLRAISDLDATFSLGPNFGYHVLACRVPQRRLRGIDLSKWRVALSGGELVDPNTVQRFTERYVAYGLREETLRPGYGLAECTLAVAVSRSGRPASFDCVDRRALMERGVAVVAPIGGAGTLRFASVGPPIPGHEVKIIEPESGRPLPPRHLGEIVVRGPSVTPGYYGDARVDECGHDELRTGDIGYLADDELHVVDRLKDLLIIAGKKYVPGDVESVAGNVAGVRKGSVVAFSARGDAGTEELYIVSAVEPSHPGSRSGIATAVNRALNEHCGVTATRILFVRSNMLPRTSSGKLQRGACRLLFELGTLGREDEALRRREFAPLQSSDGSA